MAEPPEDAGARKYDTTAGSMISLLKYGSGMPFNRAAGRNYRAAIEADGILVEAC